MIRDVESKLENTPKKYIYTKEVGASSKVSGLSGKEKASDGKQLATCYALQISSKTEVDRF